MADQSARGRFVWHDLVTSDTAAAQSFYTKVLGWKTQSWEQDPNYSMFAAASGPLGGTVSDASGQPHWIGYLSADNLQATIDQATAAGASVVKEATPAGTGEYAILKDPQGALFGVYAGGSQSKDAPAKRGEFSWHELATSDPKAALDFYMQLFGWEQVAAHDMGEMGTYYIFGRDGKQEGGIYAPQGGTAPHWLGYVRVKDVNQIVKKVKSAGGKVLNGPMEVPGGDWIVQFADPQGGALAAHTLAADLQGAKEAAAASTQSVATAEVEELSSPIEPDASESAPKKKARPARKVAKKSSTKTKAAKAKKKSKVAKKSAQKSKSAKTARKSGAKKRGAKRASAKSARGARKSAKRAATRKAAKKSATKSAKKSTKKAAKKKSRSPRKAK